MERENQKDNTIHHITHLHPLKLTDLRNNGAADGNPTCYACRQLCVDSAYECSPCGYALDPTCARLPKTLRHPAHPPHPLFLRFLPAYQNGEFRCNGCSDDGKTFGYHCAHCQFDLHLPCAALPQELSHKSHPHLLSLVYEPDPFGFRSAHMCDLCRGIFDRSSQWIYLCRSCGYGGHVNCFLSETPPKMVRGQPVPGVGQHVQQANPAAELLAIQRKLEASMIIADMSVQQSRAAANLVRGPCECTYYKSAPLPSQYAFMANNMMMNNLAMLSLNNGDNNDVNPCGDRSGPPADGNVARSYNKDLFKFSTVVDLS